MSANRWRVCPACLAEATKKRDAAIEEAAELYGKVPATEWKSKSDAAHKEIELEESMREDYELGVGKDGQFFLIYRASCQDCTFEFRIKHEQSAMEPAKPIAVAKR